MMKKKVNVLFVLLQLNAGGSEKVALNLVRNIDKSLFNVYVAFFSGGELLRDFSKACQKVFHVPKKNRFDLQTMLKIGWIIKKYQIDVINPHHYAPFFYSYLGSKILHNRALIYTEHAVSELERFSSKHKILCNLLFYNTSSIIGVSKEITDCFKKKFPSHAKKMFHITNGIEVERFAMHVDRDMVRKELNILPSHFVIGTIANFHRIKNHVCLIQAFYMLCPAFPRIRLVLVGKGFPGNSENLEHEIKNLVNSLGLENRVIFTGYREDIHNMLKCFDLFCLPSFSEGLPVSLLEAMAAGIPVVGSNVRGINEVISQGNTGLLFPSNDAESLTQALRRLIQDPELYSTLKKKAFDYVSKVHGIRQWVDNYQRAFLNSIRQQ